MDCGGGMLCEDGRATVTHCVFRRNSAASKGGGMYNEDSTLSLTNCVFSRNSATSAGAIHNYHSTIQIFMCTFRENSALAQGGAMSNGGESTLFSCIFCGNSARTGGALFNWGSGNPTLYNCTLYRNTASDGGGIFCYVGQAHLVNCILWANQTGGRIDEQAQLRADECSVRVDFCCLQGWTGGLGGEGNHGLDPLFAGADGPDSTVGHGCRTTRL
jgi:hypothetical protein